MRKEIINLDDSKVMQCRNPKGGAAMRRYPSQNPK